MSTITELEALTPLPEQYLTETAYREDLQYWDTHIAPALRDLEKMANFKPKREQFLSEEEHEEAVGYWMSRVGRVLGMRLSFAMRQWSERPQE